MAFEEIKAIYGLTQMSKAKKALNRLSNWNPEFRSGESILQEATQKTPFGFSAQEKAAFTNDLSRLNNARFRAASQGNPNMAANVQAGINFGSIGALNEFAKNDALLKQQKIGQLASSITAQDNMNVSNQISQKSQMEQAYGEAYRAGLHNVVGALDSKMNDLKSVLGFIVPGAGGAAATTTPSTTSQLAGGIVGGKTLGKIGSTGSNAVMGAPVNTSWKPVSTPSVAPSYPVLPTFSQQNWITNPNQYNPYQ